MVCGEMGVQVKIDCGAPTTYAWVAMFVEPSLTRIENENGLPTEVVGIPVIAHVDPVTPLHPVSPGGSVPLVRVHVSGPAPHATAVNVRL